MFPLGTVLVPGAVLPLHVFEPRYRALLRDLGDDRRFGVVLIERGHEVGGGDQRTDVGTAAEVVRADELADGRWSVLAVGRERLRIDHWWDDDPYPRATVTAWPDDDVAVPDDLRASVVSALDRVHELGRDLGLETPDPVDPSGDATTFSYQVTARAPLGPLDRHRLLCRPHARDRLQALAELLAEQEQVLRFRRDGAT